MSLEPRTQTHLFGHEAAEAALLRDFQAGTLAHGWLISGPQGIGKATLAYRFATTLLSSPSSNIHHPSSSVAQRIAAGSHSDLLVVEPLYDAKKEEYAREISVEQARQIGQFLALTPGEGQWRVVIVDSIDALNANAANAILKILEEPPPQAVLLLVSHHPGRLLPTIRSRCRSLRLSPLSREDFNAVLRYAASDMEAAEHEALAQLSNRSPGVALMLHEQGAVELYRQLLELLAPLPQLNTLAVHGFAERLGAGKTHANWQLFTRLMLRLLERLTAYAAGAGGAPVCAEERELWEALAQLHPAPVWAEKWQQCASQFALAEARHLDYKQVTIAFFHSLARRERFDLAA